MRPIIRTAKAIFRNRSIRCWGGKCRRHASASCSGTTRCASTRVVDCISEAKDYMDALELLLGRNSAVKLQDPGPVDHALDVIFRSALRAPDHGRLRPWRFIVIAG